ncbi:MAG: hypothetical protein ACJ746_06410 [Bryobacteraceae bacterium]
MPAVGISEFKEVLADFRQLTSLALKGVIAAPLADMWLKLGPPPAAIVGAITSLLAFTAVVWIFQFWNETEDRTLGMRMKVALYLFCAGMIASLYLLEKFTDSPGQDRERIIEGLSLRPDVAPLINLSYSPQKALRESEYDPEAVWTKESIAFLRTLITVVWVFTFVCLTVYLTIFIVLQRRRSLHPR